MIAHVYYKLIHFTGIFMIFLALGGLLVHMINGGTKGGNQWRLAAGVTHGLGLFLVLLGGFGMLARLGLSASSGWVIGKVVIWVIFGAALMLIYRAPGLNKSLWWILIILGAIASYLGIFKPGTVVRPSPPPSTAFYSAPASSSEERERSMSPAISSWSAESFSTTSG